MNKKPLEVHIEEFFGDILFKNKDGKAAFIIHIVDGHTIEISGGETTNEDGIIYSNLIQISPTGENSIEVSKIKSKLKYEVN